MKKPDPYQRVVVWSDEDNLYVGTCPELMLGGVHGDNIFEVLKELNEVIEEVIELYEHDGDPLPQPKGIPGLEMKEAA